jgi:hypothetical protein
MSACLFGRQVGLLAVRLQYGLYVFGHLSKWFTFFSLLVVCLLLSCRLLRLLVTFCVYLVAGVGGLKNGAQRNVKSDLLRNCPPTAD